MVSIDKKELERYKILCDSLNQYPEYIPYFELRSYSIDNIMEQIEERNQKQEELSNLVGCDLKGLYYFK